MRITAELFTERKGTEQLELPDGATAADLVRALGDHPQANLVIRDEDPLPLDAPLADGDEVKVLRIVSGGSGTVHRAGRA